MKDKTRTATVLTVVCGYVALWIAFVVAGENPPTSTGSPHRFFAVTAVPVLIGILFLAGLILASTRGGDEWPDSRPKPAVTWMPVAVLLIIGTMFGLVAAFKIVLWFGPVWVRWAIVGMAVTIVLIGSGRALGCAALGGVIWGALGVWVGSGREMTGRIDLILTGIMVGTMLGSVIGTLLKAGWGRDGKSP
ncbi:hypothetical protein JW935_05535 [candidate division KSB1 bacterium]|nr:hypothetical protein [candidate division KSB1 bacterium]